MKNNKLDWLRERLEHLPAHRRITLDALELLGQDERVKGLYLSGSLACGRPDMYSDVDINILVDATNRERVIQDHTKLYQQVGKLITLYSAIHMGDPNQMIAFYEEIIPIHVDYQYRIAENLALNRRHKDIAIILDNDGNLADWKARCEQCPPDKLPIAEKLQFLEDRFCGWCWYTDSKIERGELWEARECIDYFRNNVVIVLAYLRLGLPYEGSRRLEQKFPQEIIDLLVSTVPMGLDKSSYKDALLAVIDVYNKIVPDLLAQYPDVKIKQVDKEYVINAIKATLH